jgi:SM-20-related protein
MSDLTTLIDHLAEHDWAVVTDFLPPDLVASLADEARRLVSLGEFRSAGVGIAGERVVREDVRGDRIRWLDEQALTDPQAAYLANAEALRQSLNRELFLGLSSFEVHYAVYPPGAFYTKHLDRFEKSDERTVSTVFYLNEDWRDNKGGHLRLHLPDGALDITPHAGTFACFRSDTVLHEVLPATEPRYSLTGWFRRRPL